MTVYERKYPVNIFNTDLTGRLSPGGLFNFFEDIAGPMDEFGTSFIHSVTRESSGSELCRVRMSWKKNRL